MPRQGAKRGLPEVFSTPPSRPRRKLVPRALSEEKKHLQNALVRIPSESSHGT
jgi:hypothetical protein